MNYFVATDCLWDPQLCHSYVFEYYLTRGEKDYHMDCLIFCKLFLDHCQSILDMILAYPYHASSFWTFSLVESLIVEKINNHLNRL